MEIPKRLRYDTLLVLLGIGCLVAPLYFTRLVENPFVLGLFYAAGSLFLVLGVGYIKEEYDIERDLQDLKYIDEKMDLLEKFEAKEIITKTEKKELLADLKKLIFEKKRK